MHDISHCLVKLMYKTKYFFQMHLVHMSDKYLDVATALAQPGGFAVLGFFFEVVII